MPIKDPEKRKAYFQKHYAANKEMYANPSKASLAKRKAVFDAAREGPCIDCDEKFPPAFMHFDHINDDKIANPSRMYKAAGMKEMLAEMAKCELVCANCHAGRGVARRDPRYRALEPGEESNPCYRVYCARPVRYAIIDDDDTLYFCRYLCQWISD